MRFKFVPAAAVLIAAIAQPAFAFGPAGMGRDLMYTASIAPATDAKIVRAGFVRPNLPGALAGTNHIEASASSFGELSRPLSVVLNLFIQGVLAQTARAIDAGVELTAAR